MAGSQSWPASSSGASASGSSVSSSGRGQPMVLGLVCYLCGVKGDAPDNILLDMKRVWGYPADPATGHNMGKLCLLCVPRVYRARFRGKYQTVELLKEGFGKDGDLYTLWCYWTELAEAAMKEAGSNTVRVAWGREDVEAIYHGA